ncbi:MAG: ABC transporter permease [Phycisphaerae bacterium]|nr:ABC transporter permease [Phycisphaerae bacterium]
MFKYLLIWRYFIRKKVAWTAVGAVALLVMLTLVVLSVMSGLVSETKEKNHRWVSDIIISRDSQVGFPFYQEFIDQLHEMPEVQIATPTIKSFGLLESSFAEPMPKTIVGIKIDEYCKATNFAETLYYKDQKQPNFDPEDKQYKDRGFIFGIYRSYQKDAWQYVANEMDITVFGISYRGVLIGSEAGQKQRYWYVDNAASGLPDIDESYVYIDFDMLQKLALMDGTMDNFPARVNEIRVKLADNVNIVATQKIINEKWQAFKQNYTAKKYALLLDDVTVSHWSKSRQAFIAPLEKERTIMVLVFTMMAFVAAFIIFTIFYMIVSEKVKDLGIIKSSGASSADLASVFIGFGLLVGLAGSVLGSSAGYLIVTNVNAIQEIVKTKFKFELWPEDVYAISRIPDVVDANQMAFIVIIAIIVSASGALVPAIRASRLSVVQSLRVD